MRGSSGQPSAERRLGRSVHALAAVTVLLALLVFSSSALASSAPTIESESVSGLTEHDATLEAQINPGGLETTYKFQIAQSPACLPPPMGYMPCGHIEVGALPGGSVPGGSGASSVSLDLAGAGMTLQPSTTYYYRVVATNSAGHTVNGPSKTFSTPPTAKPSIESVSVSGITEHDATLEAQINPESLETTYEFWIEYGCGIGNHDACLWVASNAVGHGQIAAGDEAQTVSATPQLAPGRSYDYWVVATNSDGETRLDGGIFTTPPAGSGAPTIDSKSVSNITEHDATLEAQINTKGLETAYEFQLLRHLCPPGTEPLGCKAMIQKVPLPSGRLLGSFVSQAVSLDLNSVGVTLYPGTEYDYRVLVTSAAGKAEGGSQTFVTPEDGVQPLNTITSPGSQLGVGTQSAIGITTAHTVIATTTGQVTPPPKNTLKPKILTNAHQLAQALKQCAKKPKKQRASCRKQAHRRYGTTGKKGK
jgi:hypothetical protein